jgi:hypothetical protein
MNRRLVSYASIIAACITAGSAMGVQPMEETDLEQLHLQGLDAPAAGEVRTAVESDVSRTTAKGLQKDLKESSGFSNAETGTNTPDIETPDPNDVRDTNNLGYSDRVAEVSIRKATSADRSSSHSTGNGAAINVNNQVQSIGIENARRTPDSPINAGSLYLNNMQVDAQIKVQGR